MVREAIQKTLDYVDNNIKEDITAEELAEVAGYSVFHFYRLFQSAVGIPVMQYVLRRKLLYVIYEIGLERVWFRNIFGLLQSFYPRDRIYSGAVPPGI